MYCIGSTSVSLPSLSPQLRRHHPRASRARQQRLHIRIRYASFALANCRIGQLGTLGDLHTHTKILTFCRFTFFPAACIALRQNPCSKQLYDTWPCVSGDRRSHPRGQICSRLPATKPQIFPQDPPLVDVCALLDDADPMRWC